MRSLKILQKKRTLPEASLRASHNPIRSRKRCPTCEHPCTLVHAPQAHPRPSAPPTLLQVELFCISKLINCVLEADEEFVCMDFHFAVGDGGLPSVLQLLHLFMEAPRCAWGG